MSYNTRHPPTTTRSNDLYIIGGGIGSTTSVGGILRKASGWSNTSSSTSHLSSSTLSSSSSTSTTTTVPEVRHVDLLVFGYACKVFRDDEKARDIDQGKHLIPWMGDNSLKIDRYDVRGALYELAPYEPPPGGYGNRLDYLTADEQRAEQLCEEERYLFLYNNEEDVITRQDEELKRLKQETNGGDYSQVGLSYDQPTPIGPSREEFSNSPTCEETEQVFQLPYTFEVPEGMILPDTMKQHAIIEKTARFIASQGVQMEILLKAKQCNNVQFDFLSQNAILNPYYKHVLNALKNGTYPEALESINNIDPTSVMENTNGGGSSGTPSTTDINLIKPVVLVPTIKYKPSADCAYTQLISKIKGVPLSELHDESSRQSTSSPHENANDSPSITPILLQYNGATFVTETDENSNSNSNLNSNSTKLATAAANTNTNSDDLNDSGPKVEILKNSSALALAQNYSSDSETEEEEEAPKAPTFEKEKTPPVLEFPVPTENLKNIIDKTAVYVIKNGRQFEETLRSKSAERFTFLLPDNEYYPYYMYKITGEPNAASKESKQRKAKEVAEALISKKGLSRDKNSNNPVSFSIKNKEETATGTLQNTVLPQDASDDEDKPAASGNSGNPGNAANATSTTSQTNNRHVPEHVQKAIELVESQLMARNAQIAAALALRQQATAVLPISNVVLPIANIPAPLSVTTPTVVATTAPLTAASAAPASSSASATAPTKAEAERNAIFEQQQQQRHKELKKAEEKVKDKLAQIAREKLGGLVSKEKQLQLERKKKAMAFLNQIKAVTAGDNNNAERDIPSEEKSLEPKPDLLSDDSDDSVQSIPITSYGPEGNSDEETAENVRQHKIPPNVVTPAVAKISTATKFTKNDDNDDVQFINETNSKERVSRKRKSRSRNREDVIEINTTMARRQYRRHESSRSSSQTMCSSTTDDEDEDDDHHEPAKRTKVQKYRSTSRSKSKSHKNKKSKSKKSKSKKKSKKREKSRTRSRSRSHSRSHSHRHHHQHQHQHQHSARHLQEKSRSQTPSDESQESLSSSRRHRQQHKRSLKTSSRRHMHKDKRHRYE